MVAAAAEQQRETMAPAEIAKQIASGDLDDDAACRSLRAEITTDRESLDASVTQLAALRVDYVTDRAFRLLAAVRDDSPVRPIDPAVRASSPSRRGSGVCRLPMHLLISSR
jgi:hypothetical protein